MMIANITFQIVLRMWFFCPSVKAVYTTFTQPGFPFGLTFPIVSLHWSFHYCNTFFYQTSEFNFVSFIFRFFLFS